MYYNLTFFHKHSSTSHYLFFTRLLFASHHLYHLYRSLFSILSISVCSSYEYEKQLEMLIFYLYYITIAVVMLKVLFYLLSCPFNHNNNNIKYVMMM